MDLDVMHPMAVNADRLVGFLCQVQRFIQDHGGSVKIRHIGIIEVTCVQVVLFHHCGVIMTFGAQLLGRQVKVQLGRRPLQMVNTMTVGARWNIWIALINQG